MLRKSITVFVLLMCSFILSSHEFWLQPQRYRFRTGQTVNLKFQVGENFEGENWKGKRSSVQRIRLHFGDFSDDIENLLSDSTFGDSLAVQFFDEGSVMVTCQTENKFISLEPDQFLEYLKEDGLDDVITQLDSLNEKDSIGRELYQRNSKSLIQIGTLIDSTYKKETGLPVDIIPLSHPYLVKKKQSFSAQVLFEGQPLANQKIKLWNRYQGKTDRAELVTSEDGIISMEIQPRGQWMLSTVKMLRLNNDSTARWQSYWGTLTWGYY